MRIMSDIMDRISARIEQAKEKAKNARNKVKEIRDKIPVPRLIPPEWIPLATRRVPRIRIPTATTAATASPAQPAFPDGSVVSVDARQTSKMTPIPEYPDSGLVVVD